MEFWEENEKIVAAYKTFIKLLMDKRDGLVSESFHVEASIIDAYLDEVRAFTREMLFEIFEMEE